jgi:hypothetical protein
MSAGGLRTGGSTTRGRNCPAQPATSATTVVGSTATAVTEKMTEEYLYTANNSSASSGRSRNHSNGSYVHTVERKPASASVST